ncbi:MAG: hypothetical protein GY801_36950 [bacterium]|nr:hypothetical protein [bacterium]
MMKRSGIRTKLVVYTVFIVFLTAVIFAIGVAVFTMTQTTRNNQRRLAFSLAEFVREFTESTRDLDAWFSSFRGDQDLAVQTINTIRSGWTLEIGLGMIGKMGRYDELLVKGYEEESFAVYFAPKFQGRNS